MMKKAIKWSAIALCVVVAAIAGAVVLVPMFVDVQQYKPQIEAMVAEQTGRRFSMGDDIELSVFPWVGVSLSDLRLGNAKGFDTDEMISVKRFEVRLKVMPLLSGQVYVDKFIMDAPRILLAKNKAGKGNWDMATAGKKAADPEPKAAGDKKSSGSSLPITSLLVERFSIINGFVAYVDQQAGLRKEISDFNLELAGISLDKPVKIDLQARVDGHPLGLAGSIGPVGNVPGMSDIGLDLAVKALDQLALAVKGQVTAPMSDPGIDLALTLSEFSPRKLFAALGQHFPVETSDPGVLNKVSLAARVSGSARSVSITDGKMILDDSTLTFSARAQAFNKPDVKFDLALDQIDVDRYLPPKPQASAKGVSAKDPSVKATKAGGDATDAGKKDSGQQTPGKKASGEKSPAGKTSPAVDYGPLRTLVLDGNATVGTLKAASLTMSSVLVKVSGKNGVLVLDPFSMNFYEGKASVNATVDVRNNTPRISVKAVSGGVQAGPVIKAVAGKDIIEGALDADINLSMTGDTPEQIKQTLDGEGVLTFTDGAIIGFDIAGTIRNAKAGLGLAEATSERPKTDFAELKLPYTAEKGVVTIPDASLVSPLLRLAVSGTTSLVKESLDFKVKPKFVATLKGQGDTTSRKGLLIPLLITGTYDSPKVRPDLKSMVGEQLSTPGGILKTLGVTGGSTTDADGTGATEQSSSPKDTVKSLFKGLIQ